MFWTGLTGYTHKSLNHGWTLINMDQNLKTKCGAGKKMFYFIPFIL